MGALNRTPMKDDINQIMLLQQKQRIVFILDNAHTPVGLKIAYLLMKSPRPWRLWAAARSGEFAERSSKEPEILWSEENYIHDACDLVGEREIDFVIENVIAPILKRRGEENLIQEVHQAMKDAGQIPLRFLIRVWELIYNNRSDVETGYTPMIKGEPTGVEEIVRYVMPPNRSGIDALIIADYLKKPSWVLLTHLLSSVEGCTIQDAEATINSLVKMLALLPDSEQHCRVTMYDPVQDRIREPGNLTDSLTQQIWSGLEFFLEQKDSVKEVGNPDDLADAWISISSLAISERRFSTALSCAQKANSYVLSEHESA